MRHQYLLNQQSWTPPAMNVLGYTRNESDLLARLNQPDVRELTCRVTGVDYTATVSCRLKGACLEFRFLEERLYVELVEKRRRGGGVGYTGSLTFRDRDIGRFLAAMDERAIENVRRCLVRVYVDGTDAFLALSRTSVR